MVRAAVAGLLVGLCWVACSTSPERSDYHGYEADVATPDLGHSAPLDVPLTLPEVHADPDLLSPPAETTAPTDLSTEPQPVPTVRSCEATLTFTPPNQGPVALAGQFTNWATNELPMTANGDGSYSLTLDLSELPAGNYGYKFHTGTDEWYLDPANPLTIWVDGIENSKLIVPDCRLPELGVESHELVDGASQLNVTLTVADAPGSAGIVPASAAVLVDNELLPDPGYDPETGRFDIALTNLEPGTRVTLRATISNTVGQAQELIFPVWLDSEPWQWQDAAIYFTFTDRFANGNPDNDGPAECVSPDSLTNWQGGDFAGITAQIEAGYFTDLGINVIWLSPVIDNPDGCMEGTIEGVTYTAYHGYFPLDLLATENHFGTLEELRTLVDAAHQRGIRVLIDLVSNHLFEDNPLYDQHAPEGWFHDFYGCEPNWDKPIECWFMPYLPDLDYTNDAVVEMAMEAAVYWIVESGVDGFRVDALKHMVHNFIRTLRHTVEQRIITDRAPFYMVGETFMGEWGGGTGMAETVIKEYVNEWELNGQFDFPFYWKLVKATARDEGDFVEFADFLQAALPFWGPDAIMVSFLGNHDVPRFLSHAAGQIGDLWGNGSKVQGLNSPPALPEDPTPFARLRLAQGLLFTLPEVPLVYYGDEIGLAGAGDPDNRRNMVFDTLSGHQQQTLEFVRKVGTIRLQNGALRRGAFKVINATPETLVFSRTHDGETIIVAANRDNQERTVNLPAAGETLTELLTGQEQTVTGTTFDIQLPAFGLVIYK